MAVVFAWDDWNREHVRKHGSNEVDAKHVVDNAQSPFPREIEDGKFLVWGQTNSGGYLQVVFALRLPEELEFTSLGFLDWVAMIDYAGTVAVYIIHAMPLTGKQLRQYRKLRSNT